MQNFEADLFMMVSRTSKANLESRKPKHVFAEAAKKQAVEYLCFDQVGSGFPQVGGVKLEAGEAMRGLRRVK